MVETTKLVSANIANSLRTTVPMVIVKQMSLKEGEYLDWAMDKVNDQWIAVVSKKS